MKNLFELFKLRFNKKCGWCKKHFVWFGGLIFTVKNYRIYMCKQCEIENRED